MAESTFVYKGTDKKGKQVQGELSGASTALIKAQLLRQGIRAKSVRKKSKPLFGKGKAIKPLDIAIFTRQLSTMMKAGVPLVQSFEIVADGVDNPTMKDLSSFSLSTSDIFFLTAPSLQTACSECKYTLFYSRDPSPE